jgi:multidrug efflux system membrane fusion protein
MDDNTASHDPAPVTTSARRKSKRNPLIVTGVLILIVAGVGGAVWLARQPPKTAGGPGAGGPGGPGGGRGGRRPATTVGVAAATQADIPITIEGLGTVTSAATVTVTPQVSGVITQILYKEGQTVKKGQPLAIIDPRPLQMALNQAQGQLARDQAQLVNARLQLGRNRTLLAQDSIARQDVDTQDALVKQLEGTVTSDQANVGTAELTLGFSRVVAPVTGKVGLRPVDLGNFINAGATGGVAVITQVTPIDVEFTIPQVDLPRVQENAARCALPVTALDQSKTITLDQGVFSTLDNRIDTTTGTVKAKARFDNAKGTLFPNQFVNVRVSLESLHNVVTVPVTAVRTGPQGDFVWVLQPDKSVKLRTVTRGPATVQSTSITQGLDAGEQVITEGGDRLTEGAKVQLPGDRPMPAGGAGRRGGRGRRGANGAGPPNAAAGGAPGAGQQASSDAAGQQPGGGVRHRGGQAGGDTTAAGPGSGGVASGQRGAGRRGGGAHGAMQAGCATLPAGGGRGGDHAQRGQGRGGGGQGQGGGNHGVGDRTGHDAQLPQRPGQGRGGDKTSADNSGSDTTGGQHRRRPPAAQAGQSNGG